MRNDFMLLKLLSISLHVAKISLPSIQNSIEEAFSVTFSVTFTVFTVTFTYMLRGGCWTIFPGKAPLISCATLQLNAPDNSARK